VAPDAALDGLVPARGCASGSGGSVGWPGGCVRPRRPAARGWADTPSAVRHPAEDSASAAARCGSSSSPRWPGSQIGATRRQGVAGSGGPAHDGTGRARQLFRGVAAAPLPRRRYSSSSSLRWWASLRHGPVLLEPSCHMAPGWDARSSQPVKPDPIRSAR